MRRFVALILVLAFVLTACGDDPKSVAREWADRFPSEIGDWEKDDSRIELTSENQSNFGSVTVVYEGNGGLRNLSAHVTVLIYATTSAAAVTLNDRLLDWQLRGARFDTERVNLRFEGTPCNARFEIATLNGGSLVFYQIDETLVMLRIIPEELETEIPTEAIEVFYPVIAQIGCTQ